MNSGVRLRRAVAGVGVRFERVFKAEAFAFFPLPAPMPFPPALPLPVAFDPGDGARVLAPGLGEEGRRPLPLRSLLRRVLAATTSSLPSSSLVLPELFASNWLRALFGGGASER